MKLTFISIFIALVSSWSLMAKSISSTSSASIFDANFNVKDRLNYHQALGVEVDTRNSNFDLDTHVSNLISKKNQGMNQKLNLSGERGSGGGGDTLACLNENEGVKYTSLDYFRFSKLFKQQDFSNNDSLTILLKIYNKLKKSNPVLADGLEEFLIALLNSSVKGDRSFVFQSANIYPIYDEKLAAKLPEGCVVLQTAARHPLTDTIHYSIDIDVLLKLNEQPVYHSYFLLHEWARDFIKDADKIGPFVAYLHSEEFHSGKSDIPSLTKEQRSFLNKDYVNYGDFIKKYGFNYNSPQIVSYNTGLFSGEYLPIDGSMSAHKVHINKNTSQLSFEMNSLPIQFDCEEYHCISKSRLLPMTLKLNGFFNLITLTFENTGESTTFVKKEYYNRFKEHLKKQNDK